MIRTIARSASVGLLWMMLSGHVGSPDAWYQGAAGPYQVVVQVTPAGVVPGVATVHVRVVAGDATSVSLQTTKFDATGGMPPPEPTQRAENDAGLFTGKLWIMSSGSNSVIVNVSGEKGSGSVTVPVVIMPFSRLDIERPMAAGLLAMGVVLFAGLVTIVGAAVREGSLVPGERPTDASRTRARKAMAITTVVLAAALAGGWKWWSAEDESFVRSMYKPFGATAEISGAQPTLNVSIADSAWIHRNDPPWLAAHDASTWSPLVEDHGKLMHLFAIREDMSAFAHLHPSTVDTVRFAAAFPDLPAGRYRIFGDIVHESGFAQTVVATVNLSERHGSATATGNPDDSWFASAVARGARSVKLEDGSVMEWTGTSGPIVAGRPASLTFAVKNPDGTAATLEPYMGMAGHAVVQRSDGSVFIHLHPMGTISAASQMVFQMREPGDSIRGRLGKRIATGMPAMQSMSMSAGPIAFPYAFPRPGDYRIWVQVKRSGKIMTGAFDASVADSSSAD